MPRTYSFDHYTTVKPAISVRRRGSEREPRRPRSDGASPQDTFHYTHSHAKTEELYRRRRRRAQAEPARAQAAPEARSTAGEQAPGGQVASGMPPASQPRAEGLLSGMVRGAKPSLLRAAREALQGSPLRGLKRLAGETLTGTLRVAREVSSRTLHQPTKKARGEPPEKTH